MSELTVDELTALLDTAGCRWGASEAHGTLLGLVCAGAPSPVERWIAEIERSSDTASAAAATELAVIGDAGIAALRGEQFEFMPLLADDQSPIADRADAIAQWCQGFLYGFGLTGRDPIQDTPGDVPEAMTDLTAIAGAGFADDQPLEEAESAYVELVEFVRVAVQLVFYELALASNE